VQDKWEIPDSPELLKGTAKQTPFQLLTNNWIYEKLVAANKGEALAAFDFRACSGNMGWLACPIRAILQGLEISVQRKIILIF